MEDSLNQVWTACELQGVLQKKQEFITFLRYIIGKGVYSILEIGAYQGGTSKGFLMMGRKVVAVDKEKQPTIAALERDYPMSFMFIKGDSSELVTVAQAKEVMDTGYDLLWIDGGHTYEQAMTDYALYKPLVKKGGLIAFHDIQPNPVFKEGDYDVYKVWEDVRGEKYAEFIWEKGPVGFGIGCIVNQ